MKNVLFVSLGCDKNLVDSEKMLGLCLNGMGHPYLGMFFLLFSGLCDTFDGKVARSKKDRTTQMKKFGIQIDSLSDLIAFGMLPACIGYTVNHAYHDIPSSL